MVHVMEGVVQDLHWMIQVTHMVQKSWNVMLSLRPPLTNSGNTSDHQRNWISAQHVSAFCNG